MRRDPEQLTVGSKQKSANFVNPGDSREKEGE